MPFPRGESATIGGEGKAFLDALGIVRITAKTEAKSRSRFLRNGCEFLNPEKIKDAAGCKAKNTKLFT